MIIGLYTQSCIVYFTLFMRSQQRIILKMLTNDAEQIGQLVSY